MQTLPYTDSTRKPTTTARWATFGDEHGIAWRDDSDNSVWFQADNGEQTLLHNVDRPFLTLYGKIDLVELQALLDSLHGDLYAQVDYRNSEHARTVAAA